MRAYDGKDLDALPIAAVGPLVDAVFEAFGARAHVSAATRSSLTLPIGHIGGSKMRATLFACLSRELESKTPARYGVELINLAMPDARLRVTLAKGRTP